jgi:hypothetical protein
VVPLNRYILDYRKHQQKSALVTANGMRDGDAWQHLFSFIDTLRAVAVALDRLAPAGEEEAFDPLTYSLHRLAKEFGDKFKNFNGPMQTQRHGVLRKR